MILRPYKPGDAKEIINWIQDEEVFCKWGGERFGSFPITADVINTKYLMQNGDCIEPDNFYPWVAVDENHNVIGHFIMRYTHGDHKQLRFGWVIIDDSIRGKGYGKQMLLLGMKYAFEILDVDRITIGVFENNESAHRCYKNAGFVDTELIKEKPWNIIEMEILKNHYIS